MSQSVMLDSVVRGTRVHTILGGGRTGIVYAIRGTQSPTSVRSLGSVMVSGGGAQFDVVFESGTRSKALPEALIRASVQWRILDDFASEHEIEHALAFADAEDARKQADEEAADAAFEAGRLSLTTDPVYASLEQGCDPYSGNLAATNIRRQLKVAFPTAKFSVRKKSYGSLIVSWTDGPTHAQVEAITSRYDIGFVDAQADYSGTESTPWSTVFGGTKYLSTNRETTPALVEIAIKAVLDRFSGNFDGDLPQVTAEDYLQGRLWNIEVPYLRESLNTFVRKHLHDLAA